MTVANYITCHSETPRTIYVGHLSGCSFDQYFCRPSSFEIYFYWYVKYVYLQNTSDKLCHSIKFYYGNKFPVLLNLHTLDHIYTNTGTKNKYTCVSTWNKHLTWGFLRNIFTKYRLSKQHKQPWNLLTSANLIHCGEYSKIVTWLELWLYPRGTADSWCRDKTLIRASVERHGAR